MVGKTTEDGTTEVAEYEEMEGEGEDKKSLANLHLQFRLAYKLAQPEAQSHSNSLEGKTARPALTNYYIALTKDSSV